MLSITILGVILPSVIMPGAVYAECNDALPIAILLLCILWRGAPGKAEIMINKSEFKNLLGFAFICFVHLLVKDLKIYGSSFSPTICKLKTSL